jgi:hypothetical protein
LEGGGPYSLLAAANGSYYIFTHSRLRRLVKGLRPARFERATYGFEVAPRISRCKVSMCLQW